MNNRVIIISLLCLFSITVMAQKIDTVYDTGYTS